MRHPYPTAQVIALHHSRAEKSPLLDAEPDVAHERRRAHRLLDGLTWRALGQITGECVVIAFAMAGFVWFLNYLTASIRAGWWL